MKRALGPLLIALVIGASPIAAQRSLAIDRFDSRITVFKDGQIDVDRKSVV